MSYQYQAYGLQWASNVRLPLEESPDSGTPDGRILCTQHTISTPLTWNWEPVEGPLPGGPCRWRLQTQCGRLVIVAELADDGKLLQISHCQQIEESCLQDLILHPLLGHAARRLGHLCLHAAVVSYGGLGLALLGGSGEGKSTLASVLCRLGAEFVADDVALLRTSSNGWMVAAGPVGLRLTSESKPVGRRVFDLKKIPWPNTKPKWQHCPSPCGVSAVPLHLAVILQSSTESVELKEVESSSERLISLLQNRFGSKTLGLKERQQELSEMSQLASKLTMLHLTRPRDSALLSAQAGLLLDRLRSAAHNRD